MPEIYALSQSERNPDQQNRAIRAALERLRGMETMHALEAVKCATTANITLSGTQTIDVVSAGVGDRALVKDQTAAKENGVYVVAVGAWSRATDMDSWDEVPQAFVNVQQGAATSVNSNTNWICTSQTGGTLDTTDITWTQFQGGTADGSITNAKLADMAATKVKARGTASTGAPEDIAVGTGITLDATSLRLASMVQNTIKGRVTASTGAPEDLTADQAAAVLRSGTGTQSVLQSKVIATSRDLTTASGSVAYTGVGFKPTTLIVLAYVNATATFAVGFGAIDGSTGTIDYYGNNLVTSNGALIQIQLADGTAAKFQSAAIASFDADGFTLAWTKTGAPTGTANIYVLCLR